MTFLYQGNTDISVWSIFLFSCHVWESTVLRGHSQSTVRQWAQSHSHPLMGTTAAGLKNCTPSVCSTFSSASRTLTAISKSAPTKLPLRGLLSLKGPSATSKGSIWSKMTGRVPCNTVSVSTPPAIHNLHTAQMDQTVTSAYKESSFFSYSSCHSVLHFMKSFKPFEKARSFSHPAKCKLQAFIFSSSHLRYTKLSSEIVDGSIYCLLQTIPFTPCSIPAVMVWSREDKWGFTSISSFSHRCSCCSGNHFQGHLRRHSCSFALIHWASLFLPFLYVSLQVLGFIERW